MSKKAIITLVAAVSCFWLLLNSFVCTIPPESETTGNMHSLTKKITNYVKHHNKLPDNLSVLPPREGYNNSVKDGWGREILYIPDASGKVTLLSYGRDGKEGGDGKAADVSITFDPYDEDNFYDVVGMISPSTLTKAKLEAISNKIIENAKDDQSPPAELAAVYLDERIYENSEKDSWGNKIIYDVQEDVITLTSLGRDWKIGGERSNADIVISFKIVSLNNTSDDEVGE